MERVAVLGDGAWGTALAMVLVERGAAVIQWSWSEQRALELQTSRMNRKYLPAYKMPDGVAVTHEAEAFAHADLIVSAVPSRYLRDVLVRVKPHIGRGKPVVSATKGHEFPTHQRATVLSFKGMAFNLAYGLIGILFALLVQQLRHREPTAQIADAGVSLADAAFKSAIAWMPGYSLVVLGLIGLYCGIRLKGSEQIRRKG